MELKAEEYGMHLFSTMLEEKGTAGHWESIREKAEPLVRELIRLNSEMEGGGYKIVGYVDESGKEKLSDHKRIELAQEKLWLVKSSKLKKGDKVWFSHNDLDMYIGESEPGVVETISGQFIYVTMQGCGDEYTAKIHKNSEVFRAPKDWDEKEDVYSSHEYWLEQADKLKI